MIFLVAMCLCHTSEMEEGQIYVAVGDPCTGRTTSDGSIETVHFLYERDSVSEEPELVEVEWLLGFLLEPEPILEPEAEPIEEEKLEEPCPLVQDKNIWLPSTASDLDNITAADLDACFNLDDLGDLDDLELDECGSSKPPPKKQKKHTAG